MGVAPCLGALASRGNPHVANVKFKSDPHVNSLILIDARFLPNIIIEFLKKMGVAHVWEP